MPGPESSSHPSEAPKVGGSVQFSSVAQSCPTLCNPMNRSIPGLPVHHKLPEFTQTHAHGVGDAIQPSVIPFSSCPQSLPASGSSPMSQLVTWGGQSIGVSASASVLPMNPQDWSPLGWTGWYWVPNSSVCYWRSHGSVNRDSFWCTGVQWRPVADNRGGLLRNSLQYCQLPHSVHGKTGESWSRCCTQANNSNGQTQTQLSSWVESTSIHNGQTPSPSKAMSNSGHKYYLLQSLLFYTWCLSWPSEKKKSRWHIQKYGKTTTINLP